MVSNPISPAVLITTVVVVVVELVLTTVAAPLLFQLAMQMVDKVEVALVLHSDQKIHL
jgi:hypothetical protein